jgi:hypothetical protein
VSISRSSWVAGAVGLAFVLAHCSPPTNCLRYSDCSDGLTCAAGKCVPPPASVSDSGDDALVPEDVGVVSEPDGDSTVVDAALDTAADSADDGATSTDDAPTVGEDAPSDATAE